MGWIRLDDGFLDHPKFLAAGPLAGYLQIAGIAWCNHNRTDGVIPRAQPARLVAWHTANDDLDAGVVGHLNVEDEPVSWAALVARLLAVGLWTERPDGTYEIHDYLEWQSSADTIFAKREAISAARSEAGKRGSAKRWNGKRNSKADSKPVANTWQPDSEEGRTNKEEEKSYDFSSPENHREDISGLCSLLAGLVVDNGRPAHLVDGGSAAWRDAARLMLDRDGRPVDEAARLIRWCQTDEFWRSNILSMPKFRDQYDQLRLKATPKGLPAGSEAPTASEWERIADDLEAAERNAP